MQSKATGTLDAAERLVAMRIVTTGLFGLLWKKKHNFLVLEWDDPSGLNVPIILSFNAANKALAEIQNAKAALPASKAGQGYAASSAPSSRSPADRIRELKQLLDEGLLLNQNIRRRRPNF